MEHQIRDFIQRKFRPQMSAAPFNDHSPLFSSGIVDSFGVLELIAFLEDSFGITINPSEHELEEFDTVAKIGTLVARLRQ